MLGRSRLPVCVALIVGATSCDENLATSVQPLTITPSAASVPADGASTITLTATIDATLDPTATSVTFTTTGGTFLPGATTLTVPVAITRAAVATLRAPIDPGTALVTATWGGTTQTLPVTFTSAPPTRVEVGAKPVSIKPTETTEVAVALLRAPGVASSGTLVTFSSTLAGAQFSPQSIMSTGATVTTRFSPGLTDYSGPVVITASATTPQGKIDGSTTIQIVK